MRRAILLLVIFVLLLAAPSGIRYLRFHTLSTPERTPAEAFDPTTVAAVPTPAASNYTEEPVVGDGIVLLDQAHDNAFTLDEIGYLDGRFSQRGFELVPYTGGDLATALRPATSFVVITPLVAFTDAEVQAVSDFVDRGGRLLLVGDPTRFNVIVEEDAFEIRTILETDEIPLNSLANAFDITFNGDYLYNTVENEGNFRNIIMSESELASSTITADLERLAFYSTHSLQVGPTGTPLLMGDENTWSSATDRPGGLVLAATGGDDRVLALGDIHFLTDPYYTVYDNGRFIAQMANFLTSSVRRDMVLADFPYFYGDEVALAYSGSPQLGPDAFDEIITLQDAFRDVDKSLSLTAVVPPPQDGVILGLYNQADDVVDILATAGITLTIQPPIEPPDAATPAEEDDEDEETAVDESETEETAVRLIQSDLGNVHMAGTALLLLDESDGAQRLVVLAASEEGLETAVDRLLGLMPPEPGDALSDCLLQSNLALCPTGISEEPIEAELQTGDGAEEAAAEEEPEEEEAPDEETPEEQPGGELPDAADQGAIGLGETVEATLAEEEIHAWTFAEGPATIDVLVQADDDLDAILEIYDPDGDLMAQADDSFAGGEESLTAVDIPDEGEYIIIVRDFFDDGGGYTLAVTASEADAEETAAQGIFIFGDNDGLPITDDVLSTEAIASQLEADYDVTTWISTVDGPLEEGMLDDYQLVIWDSGDFQDDEGLFGDDAVIITDYIESGGDVFVTGSAPPLLTGLDLAPLAEVEIAGDDPVLLDGLTAGDLIPLDQMYETLSSEFFAEDAEEGSVAFLLRGPNSEGAGSIVGLAAPETEFNNQKTVILLIPFVALPTDIRETMLNNLINWFELSE